MILPPPTPTRTDTLFPYTTLCRSVFDGSAQRPTRGILRQFRQIEYQNRTTVGENRRAADAGHAADLRTDRLAVPDLARPRVWRPGRAGARCRSLRIAAACRGAVSGRCLAGAVRETLGKREHPAECAGP